MGCKFLLFAYFIFLKYAEASHDNTLQTQLTCDGAAPFTGVYQPACSYTEGETVWIHATTDTVDFVVYSSIFLDASTGLFYTKDGCLIDEGLLFGDPNLVCSEKATSSKDYGQFVIEHDGQRLPSALQDAGHHYLDIYQEVYSASRQGDLDYIPIDTVDDCDVEGGVDGYEVFSVLSRPQNNLGFLDTPDPQDGFEVRIVDNDDEFCFESENIEVVEGADADILLSLTVKRTGVLAAKTIEYSTTSLTANLDDFDSVTLGNIVFGLGSTEETVDITIKCDGEVEGPEMFAVDLYHPTDPDPSVCTGKICRPGRAFVTIHDHQKSLFSFEYHDYAVCEPLQGDSEKFTLNVVRRGNIDGESTIELRLRDISAEGGLDYTSPASLSITFEMDETSKEVCIDINSDASKEDPETFELFIKDVSGKNDVISKPCTTVVTIHDSSTKRSCVEFAAPAASVLESSSVVRVTLLRSGNVEEAVQIGLTTADIDAKSVQDYNGLQSSPISFGPGQTSVTETITIVNDQIKETDECFQLSLHKLTNAVDNVDICSTDATVVIKDDDDQFYFEGIFAMVEEGQCTEVKILRSGYLDQMSSVRVTAVSAVPLSAETSDYEIQDISSAIQFGNNQDSHTLRVCATDDSLYEKDEKFLLVLQPNDGINNNGQIQFPDRVTVVIVSNDQEPISCDPVCVNGECVEGNNCDCDREYAGERCEIQITCSLELPNGSVEPLQDAYDVGSEVTCSCDTGYRLVAGISTLTCILVPPNAAKWSPQTPICTEEEGRPPIISCDPDCGDNGECAEGNNCVCETGYTGYRCQTQVTCSPLLLANGKLESLQNDYDVGTQVTCRCDTGYQLAGTSTLTCSHIAANVAIWSPQPPICIEEREEDIISGLIGAILGGIALLGVLVGLPLVAFLCCRNVINPLKGPLQQQPLQQQPQPLLQLMPYEGVNQYPFTGNAQTVAQPLMF
ncbi:uncharacterized protein [Amphiura filiformis]|uniref:uncharacterized protein isoform X2 n=1 Tax=Amphiura filiformis TaxID=82378 RepID=UPI003B20C26A